MQACARPYVELPGLLEAAGTEARATRAITRSSTLVVDLDR